MKMGYNTDIEIIVDDEYTLDERDLLISVDSESNEVWINDWLGKEIYDALYRAIEEVGLSIDDALYILLGKCIYAHKIGGWIYYHI